MKPKKHKLSLVRHTVRALVASDLDQVLGGMAADTNNCNPRPTVSCVPRVTCI